MALNSSKGGAFTTEDRARATATAALVEGEEGEEGKDEGSREGEEGLKLS